MLIIGKDQFILLVVHFGDEDYIWMKDYLQLDGMCYKLTPIKTKVNKSNPFDMGRIDSEIMYNQIISWDWGNSGENIYHDPETKEKMELHTEVLSQDVLNN